MSKYDIHNITAIVRSLKHREGEPPPSICLVVTASSRRFRNFIDELLEADPRPKYRKHSGTDITVAHVRYLMCSHERTMRGLRKFDVKYLEDAHELRDYQYIKDRARYQFKG